MVGMGHDKCNDCPNLELCDILVEMGYDGEDQMSWIGMLLRHVSDSISVSALAVDDRLHYAFFQAIRLILLRYQETTLEHREMTPEDIELGEVIGKLFDDAAKKRLIKRNRPQKRE